MPMFPPLPPEAELRPWANRTLAIGRSNEKTSSDLVDVIRERYRESGPSFRHREALRPRPWPEGNALERPASRSRQAARVHARIVDAPCRRDDGDRRHRLDG